MRILFAASECAPFVKTGGLADVIGAVPKALCANGADVRILLPAYPALAALVKQGKPAMKFDDLFGSPAHLVEVSAAGLNLLLLDAPHLYDRSGNIYLNENGKDWDDNHLRFGALCVAAARVAAEGAAKWQPQIVHGHDWQAGLVPLLIMMKNMKKPPRTVMTIHNIAFQGLFHWSMKDIFGIPDRYFTYQAAEYWGHLGFLKAGLALCDKITTVSPTYAQELLTGEFGMGLEGLLQAREQDLTGIVNGIDLEEWDPATDKALAKNYTGRSLKRKRQNRDVTAKRFGLEPRSKGPLFCVVSRLTNQKGLDVLLEVIPELVGQGAQLAVLGSGEKHLEEGFSTAAKKYPGQVGAVIGYDEQLSHLMQGSSDAIIIPSRFEPCGLTQLYGLRYGTLPLAAKTGGLADTIVDADATAIKSKRATGFLFSPVDRSSLSNAIIRACELFDQPEVWKSVVRNAMRTPVGWEQSAPAYLALYKQLLADKTK